MKKYTVTKYEIEDYDDQENKIEEMSNQELATHIRYLARGWLPDYNFTGDESDFEYHRDQMIMNRVANILENMKG